MACVERTAWESGSFAHWITRYLQVRAARGLAPSTLKLDERALRLLSRFLIDRGRLDPVGVCGEELATFLAWAGEREVACGRRRGQRVLAATLCVWRRALRGFFAWLAREGEMLLDPAWALVKIRPCRGVPRVLTREEVERLLGAVVGEHPLVLRDRAILELFYSSGLRMGELLGLDLGDLDLIGRELSVRRGKGGRGRRVPVGEVAARTLRAYLTRGRLEACVRGVPDPRAVFLSRLGRRLSRSRLGTVFGGWVRRAGLSGGVTPHTLRHTAAVHLLKGGADVRYVQELLGHASLRTTANYTRLTVDDLKAALDQAHPRARMGV